MGHYSIHHAALRIDYLVMAYSRLAEGAPYDPQGIPAEIMHDLWHVAGSAGIAPLPLVMAGWMRYVADFQSIEDEVQRRDPRLAEMIGTTITGIDWECMSEVIQSGGGVGESARMPLPPGGTLPHERRARGLEVLEEWARQSGCPPQLDLQARLIRCVADVVHWASWMDLDHQAVFAAGAERYRTQMMGVGSGIRRTLQRADIAAWRAVEQCEPLSAEQWQRLADVYRGRTQGDLEGPVRDLAAVLFGG